MDSIADELNLLRSTKSEIKTAITDMGVEVGNVPFRKYAELIGNIATSELAMLKKALRDGTAKSKYPVGNNISDQYNNHESPWTVMDYKTAKLANKLTKDGVYLVRLIPEVTSPFGNKDYAQSQVHQLLNSGYLSKCSKDFKKLVTEIAVPYNTAADIHTSQNNTTVKAKCWLLSATEIMGKSEAGYEEGVAFELWKQRTGLSIPSNGQNGGRILRDSKGNIAEWWTRTPYDYNSIALYYVRKWGDIWTGAESSPKYLVVGCFIAKD